MTNDNDKQFFYELCKVSGVNPKDVISLVWGKIDKHNYWYGEDSKTIRGNNIWQARTEAISKGLADGLLRKTRMKCACRR